MRAQITSLAILAMLFGATIASTKFGDAISQVPDGKGGAIPLGVTTFGGFVTVDAKNGGALYYWFVPSQNNPATDPIILWLQGGPGCSSLFGAFVENGPLKIDAQGNVSPNPYSWNQKANLIYIDSPLGTGYSYVNNSDGYARDEKVIANDLYVTLTTFLFQLHPEYSGNAFYIAGESYAGKYVPWLASTILNNNNSAKTKINLKGVAIGDGWTQPYYQAGSYAPFLYANNLINAVELDLASALYQGYKGLIDIKDYTAAEEVGNAMLNALVLAAGNVDVYDIRYHNGDPTDPLQASLTTYLNTPSVRQQMNAGNHKWGACKMGPYIPLLNDMSRSAEFLVPRILKQIPVLLYNGNKDVICNYMGTKTWSEAMVWPGQSAFIHAQNNSWSVSGNAAGYWKSAQGLTHLIVYDAGHMVPFSQPENSLNMIYSFIQGLFH